MENAKYIRLISFSFICLQFLFFIKNYRHIHNFTYTPYINYEFTKQARDFEQLSSGQKMIVPINPAGWNMTLIKK